MTLLAATTSVDYPELSVRLFMDLAAIAVLTHFMFLRRHNRRDLFMVFVAFNIGLFAVLSVISTRHINPGLGFGLFAILSIIRLRSAPFSNLELGYFFATLVLALVNGLAQTDLVLAVVLDVLVLAGIWFIDHPSLHTNVLRRRVILDAVYTDPREVHAKLAAAFAVDIAEVSITDVDYVRETTRAVIRFYAPTGESDEVDYEQRSREDYDD